MRTRCCAASPRKALQGAREGARGAAGCGAPLCALFVCGALFHTHTPDPDACSSSASWILGIGWCFK
eukprot:7376546-Prymnesium_polylepis.1